MITTGQAIRLGAEQLREVPDPQVDAIALLEKVTGKTPLELRLHPQDTLTAEQEERFRSLLLLRSRREPLQYLLGTQCFYGLEFAVDQRVLIPRPETETLCELALRELGHIPRPRVLDLCTGSGAIAVTLKKHCPQAEVTACDISEEALAVAKQNAILNDVDVRFLQGDLLAPVAGEQYDLLACNPPYIKSAECETLQPEVTREPRLALDGGVDGLAFYRRLATDAPTYLADSGWMIAEVGDRQAEQVAALLSDIKQFCTVNIHLDLFGIKRFVSARRTPSPT